MKKLAWLSLLSAAVAAAQGVADFEDIPLGTNAFYNGADGAGGFRSEGVYFHNTFDNRFGFDFWTGTAVSSVNDTNTPGYLNQYAVFSGTGRGGGGQYGVVFDNDEEDYFTFTGPSRVHGLFVNNTTYAALVMQDGDPLFGLEPFGGPDGSEPDTFTLTIEGRDAGGISQGTVDFYLADFRTDSDVIVNDWTFVDLTPLGEEVESLHFELASTDTFMGFNNTPNYFALDDIQFESRAASNCAMSGVVWNDLSNDGNPGNENLLLLGFEGIEVQLLNTNGVLLGGTVSAKDGSFCLDPEPGAYLVRVIAPEIGRNGLGIASTPTQYAVRVVEGQRIDDLYFGGLEVPCQTLVEINGIVWSDLDNDGSFVGEPLGRLGIAGVRIFEANRDGANPIEVAVTTSNGAFSFLAEICAQLIIEVPTNFNAGRFSVPVPFRYVFDVVYQESSFAIFPVVPEATAVEMVRTEARIRNDGVNVQWETGIELDHLGFRVWWAPEDNVAPVLLNTALILAQGSGSGAEYSFEHEGADGSGQYFVEDLSTSLEVTRHQAIRAARPAPPTSEGGAVSIIMAEADAISFRSRGGDVLLTGFSRPPLVWDVTAEPVQLVGDRLEIPGEHGVYLGLPPDREIQAHPHSTD